jgi:hypothetical protein
MPLLLPSHTTGRTGPYPAVQKGEGNRPDGRSLSSHSASRPRRCAAAPDRRGVTRQPERELQGPGLLAPGVLETHGGPLALLFGPSPDGATMAAADFSHRPIGVALSGVRRDLPREER